MRKFTWHFYGTYLRRIIPTTLCICIAIASQQTAAQNHADWSAYNRRISIEGHQLHTRYQEHDAWGITPDGIFNSEKGNIHGWALGASWQGNTPYTSWGLQPYLAAEIARSNGATNYNGYLQYNNGVLAPYRSRTGNIDWRYSARLGAAFALNPRVQIVPHIHIQHRRWLRDLNQYQEQYRHTAALFGVLAQWHISSKFTLETHAAYGRIMQAHLKAPTLNFNQSLGKKSIWQIGASIHYQLFKNISVHAGLQHQGLRYGQSALRNGLQAPASKAHQTQYKLGLAWHY